MNITFEQIIDIVENGLSEAEINSFKHGNTPTEMSRIKAVVGNIWPHCQYNTTTRHEALREAYMLVDQAPNIEVLERKAASICGQHQ